jgi:hypothetical protein
MREHKPLAITADDVAVSLAVREDLGVEHEPAVIAEFLDRVSGAIDERVDAQVAARLKGAKPRRESDLPVVSLIFGIPLTAIGATQGLTGMLVCWGSLIAINIADALRRH